MSWLLQIGDGQPQSFTALQCIGLKRAVRSQMPGTFTFRLNIQAMDSAPIANPDDLAQVLWVDGITTTILFSGRVTRIPLMGSSAAEDQTYEISDAWSDFERITFQQQWNRIISVDESGTPTTALQYSACCLLGVDVYGNPQSSDAVITEAVTWAMARGAHCQIGQILMSGGASTGSPVPVDEVTDLPVAEIIKKMMRFTPDAVAWFDYRYSPPRFNVTRRSQCAPFSEPFTDEGQRVDIVPRNDLLRSEVLIRYEQENQTDGTPTVTAIADAAPDGADGLAFNAMVSTVRLAGSNSTFQKQYVQTTAIPNNNSSGENGGPADDPTIDWWWNHVPWLQKFSKDRLSVTSVSGTVDPGQMDPNGDGETIEDDITKYPNELISGTVAPWMNCYVGHTTWTALVYYNYPDTSDTESDAAENVFGPDDGSDNASAQLPIYAQVVATSAVTQTYAQLSSYTGAEPVPTGLAARLYGALNPLQYEGSWNVVRQEPDATAALGVLLNLTGGREEWASMNALVQQITDDLDTGVTTYKFGPAGHLSIQDLMEQLRATRLRTISSKIKERATGRPGDAPTVIGASHGPDSSSSTPPSTFRYPWIDYIDETDDGDGNPLTYDALLGYGSSSFADVEEIDHASPLEAFEISVGKDSSSWLDSGGEEISAQTSLTNAFSLICGDQNPASDRLWLGRQDGDGGGSLILTPSDPSLYLSTSLDPSTDGDGDPYINIDLSVMLIEIQDSGGSVIDLDLSGDPIIKIENADTGSNAYLDENSLNLTDGESGNAADLEANSLSLFDAGTGATITIDASATGGHDMSVQEMEICVSGSTKHFRVLASDTY